VFKVKESGVRRRYSDFEWLRNELERDSKVRKLCNCLLQLLEELRRIIYFVPSSQDFTVPMPHAT